MKIAIVSDSHDHRAGMRKAIEQSKADGAEAVLHCGDVVAAYTLVVMRDLDIPIHVIHGNNMGDLYSMVKVSNKPDNSIQYYGQDAKLTMADRKIFMVHYPEYADAFATTGDWDMVCCGHDHKVSMKWVDNIKGGKTLVLNPGSIAGLGGPPTYLFGDLTTMEFEAREVSL